MGRATADARRILTVFTARLDLRSKLRVVGSGHCDSRRRLPGFAMAVSHRDHCGDLPVRRGHRGLVVGRDRGGRCGSAAGVGAVHSDRPRRRRRGAGAGARRQRCRTAFFVRLGSDTSQQIHQARVDDAGPAADVGAFDTSINRVPVAGFVCGRGILGARHTLPRSRGGSARPGPADAALHRSLLRDPSPAAAAVVALPRVQ